MTPEEHPSRFDLEQTEQLFNATRALTARLLEIQASHEAILRVMSKIAQDAGVDPSPLLALYEEYREKELEKILLRYEDQDAATAALLDIRPTPGIPPQEGEKPSPE